MLSQTYAHSGTSELVSYISEDDFAREAPWGSCEDSDGVNFS